MDNNIEETPITNRPIEKIYIPKQVYVGTFIGGPIVAGYLFYINYKYLGNNSKAKNALLLASIFTILLFVSIFSIPETVNIPNYIIPIAYSAIASGIFSSIFSKHIDSHLEKRGSKYSWGNLILVSIIGLIITISIAAIIFFVGFND